MTCYQRMHEVLLGVSRPSTPLDWDAILWDWLGVSDVHGRDHMLERMGVDPIDLYELPSTDLSRFAGLIASGRVDQEFLYRHRDLLRGFLDQGTVIVFSGQMFRPWLPGAQDATLVKLSELGGSEAVKYQPHPIFENLDPKDLGAGFVHGFYPAPAGAEIVAELPDGRSAIYIDRTSSNGTILLHAGNNFMHYIIGGVNARGVIPNLIAWINAEAEARSAVGAGV